MSSGKLKVVDYVEQKELKQFINFGDVPLGNNLFDNEKEALTAKQYPLSVQQCQNCNHFQLTTSVSPKVLYATNYTYLSNVGKSFVRHISTYVKWIKEKTNIKKTISLLILVQMMEHV